MIRPVAFLAASVVAASVGAQTTSACPATTGIWIAADSVLPTLSPRTRPVDTTWTFDIAQRTWTRPSYDASIALSLAPVQRQGDARACAGVDLHMQNPTLTIRRARGTVRLRADLSALQQYTTRRDTARAPRR